MIEEICEHGSQKRKCVICEGFESEILINDLNRQIADLKYCIETQKNEVKKLHLLSFDIWRFENTVNISHENGESGGFNLESFESCVKQFFDDNF